MQEASGDIHDGEQQQSDKYRAAGMPGMLTDSGTDTHAIVYSSSGDIPQAWEAGGPPHSPSGLPLGLCCRALMRLSPTATGRRSLLLNSVPLALCQLWQLTHEKSC